MHTLYFVLFNHPTLLAAKHRDDKEKKEKDVKDVKEEIKIKEELKEEEPQLKVNHAINEGLRVIPQIKLQLKEVIIRSWSCVARFGEDKGRDTKVEYASAGTDDANGSR